MALTNAKSGSRLENSLEPTKSWVYYLLTGLVVNQVIWGATLIYLKVRPPEYTSKWAIAVSGIKSSTKVSLPGIGEASSQDDSSFNSQTSDPRENYKYLAEADEVIAIAANQLSMSKEEFGEPQIKILDNSTLLEFEMDGSTPKEAQLKAIALQNALESKLKQIRSEEVTQQDRNTENALNSVRQKLQIAQQRLYNFKASSSLNSNEQLRDLTSNLESLRRQQAETVAQQQQTTARVKQLTADLDLSTPQAVDALRLQSDPVFQQYLADYSRTSAELNKLRSKYLIDTPVIVSKQEEKEVAQVALLQRGRSILKRPISQDTLQQLTLSGGSSGSYMQRANLFQELVSLRQQPQGLQAQVEELGRQINKLEGRLSTLSEQESKLENLQRDVKIAEAVFSSSLTKHELSKSNGSASYPPASLVAKPSLPEETSAPNKNLVLLGTALSSLFFSSGIALMWLRDRKFQRMKEIQEYKLQKTESIN